MQIEFATDGDYKMEKITEYVTRAALKQCGGSRTETALLLGVSIRTLRNWIRKYKLSAEFPASFGKTSHSLKK
jgi:DNA-binding NtrC family response regulator